ncbi:M64 family metallopeptidase [Nonomuraea cavernae]|uniref:M64 family metallopeptidase n=1 Tax=Nonomuraea cavernae TaxID=2045107 RepID=UPI0033E40695
MQRLITMDNGAFIRYADLVAGTVSGNRQILALGNSGTYGGAGGTYATASGSNAMSALISPHEIGHSLGGLRRNAARHRAFR